MTLVISNICNPSLVNESFYTYSRAKVLDKFDEIGQRLQHMSLNRVTEIIIGSPRNYLVTKLNALKHTYFITFFQ